MEEGSGGRDGGRDGGTEREEREGGTDGRTDGRTDGARCGCQKKAVRTNGATEKEGKCENEGGRESWRGRGGGNRVWMERVEREHEAGRELAGG